jgi:hypothetical protein
MTTPAVVRALLTASLLGCGAAAATAQPVADRASIRRDVRVMLSDGTQRRGELVSLSSTDVHVRERRGLSASIGRSKHADVSVDRRADIFQIWPQNSLDNFRITS